MARFGRSLLSLAAVIAVACNAANVGSERPAPLNASIEMIDPQHGWAWGTDHIAITNDGARTFRNVTPKLPAGAQLDAPTFVDATEAFAFAVTWDRSTLESSVLERTMDGGAT